MTTPTTHPNYWLHTQDKNPHEPQLNNKFLYLTGSNFGLNIAGVAGGAVPPLITGTLQATYGSWTIGVTLATLTAASLACTYLLPETNRTTLRSTRSACNESAAS